jgi:hypothetical protein
VIADCGLRIADLRKIPYQSAIRNHPLLNAFIGSTRDAFRPGKYPTNVTVTTKIVIATAIVNGHLPFYLPIAQYGLTPSSY